MADIVKLTVTMVHGKCSLADYRVSEGTYLDAAALPAVSLVFAPALAMPNILVQLDCVAAEGS